MEHPPSHFHLYACGAVSAAIGVPGPMRRFARWDGATWSEVAGGFEALSDYPIPQVTDLAAFAGHLYVCGDFDFAGSDAELIDSHCIAKLTVSPGCPADVAPEGGDLAVNQDDLLAIIRTWGPCPSCNTDISPLSGDGVVNVNDLLTVINAWGPCP